MILPVVIFLAFADLASVKTEPDLNRRAELALLNADQKLDEARQAYQAGKDDVQEAAIAEVEESVTLCYASLEQTHGTPRKSKYYKHAELKVSALMRRLSGFREEVGFEFRPRVEAVIKKLSDIHDQLISDIMGPKKQ